MARASGTPADTQDARDTPPPPDRPPRSGRRRRRWAWLGLAPFLAYITILLLIPTGELIVDAFRTGPPSSVATVTLKGTPTGGTFTVTVNGYTTVRVPYDATGATLGNDLSNLDSGAVPYYAITASGPAGGPYKIATPGLAAVITANGSRLTGGSSPSALASGNAITPSGSFTLSNISGILQGQYLSAFLMSIELSGLSALIGGVLGFLVANAVVQHGIPRWCRPALVSFSGMASNFAGIPLAFAFGATLGATGVLTGLFGHLGLHIYPSFSLTNVLGLSLVYVYFQFPLMILLVLPALDGLRKEWKEAAANLGASPLKFWRYVGLPIVAPSVLGMMVLLFGSAFSAYATASALSGNAINLVTIDIADYVNGNITTNPQLAYALAFGMIVVIVTTVVLYTLLQRRASRWLR